MTRTTRSRSALLTIAATSALALAGCGGQPAETAKPTATTAAGSTTQATTIGPDVSLPSAADLDLDLPGVTQEVDSVTCTLRVDILADTLRFARDSADLPPTGPGRDALNAVLDQFAESDSVQVYGHASTEGLPARNVELSQQRAAAVADAGRARHPEVTFVPEGLGSTATTVVEDGTEATRSQNRRVELVGTVRVKECASTG